MGEFASPPALYNATWDSAGLRYLDGGGDGCTYPDGKPSFARRRFHHFTFYGFMLCFAATVVGTIYHYVFAIRAPYPFWSLPVLLGTVGGVGLLAGPAGLLWLKYVRDPDLTDRSQTGMDVAFLALLFLTSLTGLVLMAIRETAGNDNEDPREKRGDADGYVRKAFADAKLVAHHGSDIQRRLREKPERHDGEDDSEQELVRAPVSRGTRNGGFRNHCAPLTSPGMS